MKNGVRYVACLFGIGIFLFAASAVGLDGYADRSGFFAGVKLGGGLGTMDVDAGQRPSGFGGEREPGIDLGLEFGAGVSENLLISLEPGLWYGSVTDSAGASRMHRHLRLLGSANYILYKGLYLDGAVGWSLGHYEWGQSDQEGTEGETGFALQAGLGYEYFINGTHAVGFFTDYTRHIYTDSTFDTWTVGLSFRWH
jgi:hypothetical protein